MKILCDVCGKKEASVFCTADEAALCDGCDQRVHHANKLASKHERFSLLYPSSSHVPLCDICQEKRALLFCQQDRAILCRDCELPLHAANEYTQKHNRFLLTGIKLSEICDTSNNNNGCDPVPEFKSTEKPSSEIPSSASVMTNSNPKIDSVNHQLISSGPTSSISEYLIEMLPGWKFEDFLLDSTSPAPFGFCKNANVNEFEADEDVLGFWDVDISKKMTSLPTQSENLGIWVPQAPTAVETSSIDFGQPLSLQNPTGLVQLQGVKQQDKSANVTKMNRNWRGDDGFTVPQITQSVGSKRARPFW